LFAVTFVFIEELSIELFCVGVEVSVPIEEGAACIVAESEELPFVVPLSQEKNIAGIVASVQNNIARIELFEIFIHQSFWLNNIA
jgi:hypothetical protein